MKILVVDDDDRNIFAMNMVLRSMGAICRSAVNGQEGILALKDDPDLDLVLMDMMMPVMDGYEAIRLIKNNRKYSEIPIVALTARAMKGDQQKCLEAGADAYVSKPVDIEELTRVVLDLKRNTPVDR